MLSDVLVEVLNLISQYKVVVETILLGVGLANISIGNVNKYRTMHYFGIPTLSLIAYKILTEYFWKFQLKIVLWERC